MFKQLLPAGLRLAALTCAVGLISACGTVSEVDGDGKTQEPIFPAATSASMPEGYYVNRENLGNIRPGMTKKQIRELIGHPQFNEGMFGVREWDYLFKFREPEGQPDKVCQFKVLFDKDTLAQSFYFLPADCMEKPAPAPVAVSAPKSVTLAADATFAFARSELRPEGRDRLSQLAGQLQGSDLRSVSIVGYTDRIGNDEDNFRLSEARARSVRDYLVSQGVPGAVIDTEGRGPAEPLVNCPGPKSPAVIECLAPNRRTTITIQTRQ